MMDRTLFVQHFHLSSHFFVHPPGFLGCSRYVQPYLPQTWAKDLLGCDTTDYCNQYRIPKDCHPIGYYVFPFELKLSTSIDSKQFISLEAFVDSANFFSLSCPGDFFIREYDVTACAFSDSQTVLTNKTNFFIHSNKSFTDNQESVVETIRSNKYSPKVCITRHFPESSVLQIDTVIVIQRKSSPGFSLRIAQKDPPYELGTSVIIVVSPTLSDYHHIDSVSYRLLRHVEANPGFCDIANGETEANKFTDVLFGVIRPAFNDSVENDQIELPLPPASYTECVWTTNMAQISYRYEVEVSIASSLNPSLLPSSKAAFECPPIVFAIPVVVVPPSAVPESSLPQWTSLCLFALTEDEWNTSSDFSKKDQSGSLSSPCQTVVVSGGKRGPAGISSLKVQENPEFTKIPVLRHLGASHF
ncbi:unnamed protein product [Rodentolepis nana]|uniref:CUB domain-containing protein n=1 Tax=Rodentolepis nana TaxID=102285 RepID=A0A0R3T3P7_RODNA|nr:unnamed protein product [Rodentolepis nana]